MPMNEPTLYRVYWPSISRLPVPVLPATRYPATAARVPVAPSTVDDRLQHGAQLAARHRGLEHLGGSPARRAGVTRAVRRDGRLTRCGWTYMPSLAMAA